MRFAEWMDVILESHFDLKRSFEFHSDWIFVIFHRWKDPFTTRDRKEKPRFSKDGWVCCLLNEIISCVIVMMSKWVRDRPWLRRRHLMPRAPIIINKTLTRSTNFHVFELNFVASEKRCNFFPVYTYFKRWKITSINMGPINFNCWYIFRCVWNITKTPNWSLRFFFIRSFNPDAPTSKQNSQFILCICPHT